jgi:hypothetical protein
VGRENKVNYSKTMVKDLTRHSNFMDCSVIRNNEGMRRKEKIVHNRVNERGATLTGQRTTKDRNQCLPAHLCDFLTIVHFPP